MTATPAGQMPRRYVRTEVGVDLNAVVDTGERKGHCNVENISSGGARVSTRIPLSRAQNVVLSIGNIGTVSATVAWVNRNTYGLKFDTDMEAISELLLAVAVY